jgi:hypothetical protein
MVFYPAAFWQENGVFDLLKNTSVVRRTRTTTHAHINLVFGFFGRVVVLAHRADWGAGLLQQGRPYHDLLLCTDDVEEIIALFVRHRKARGLPRLTDEVLQSKYWMLGADRKKELSSA